MVDLRSILTEHRSKIKSEDSHDSSGGDLHLTTSSSEIPDVFFDKIIVDYKLNRMEILVLMYIYRRVWCYPNLHRSHGISQMMSHTEMAKNLGIAIEEVYSALRKLEEYDFIKTIRAGQYFSRRYFSKKLDEEFGQTYDDFEI
jgi:DNA-binding MarR family transcriptional regulator